MGDWTGWISSTVWAHEPARDWTTTIGFTLYLFKPRSGIDSLHIQYLEVHSSGLFNYCMRNTWRWLDSQDPTNPAIHLHDMTVSITRGRYVDNNAMSWIIFGSLHWTYSFDSHNSASPLWLEMLVVVKSYFTTCKGEQQHQLMCTSVWWTQFIAVIRQKS